MKRKTSDNINKISGLKENKGQKHLLPYVLCAVSILVLYSLFYSMALIENGVEIKKLMIYSIIAVVFALLCLVLFNRNYFF